MAISIDDKAIDYLVENDKSATIRYIKQGWCHTGNVDVPTIHLGKPKYNLDDYQRINIKGITLYVIRDIDIEKENLKLSISKLFKWKKLTLEGGRIRK